MKLGQFIAIAAGLVAVIVLQIMVLAGLNSIKSDLNPPPTSTPTSTPGIIFPPGEDTTTRQPPQTQGPTTTTLRPPTPSEVPTTNVPFPTSATN